MNNKGMPLNLLSLFPLRNNPGSKRLGMKSSRRRMGDLRRRNKRSKTYSLNGIQLMDNLRDLGYLPPNPSLVNWNGQTGLTWLRRLPLDPIPATTTKLRARSGPPL